MENSFYYADLDVRVRVLEDIPGTFENLSDNERLVLQQQLYLTLTTFLYTRALFYRVVEEEGG